MLATDFWWVTEQELIKYPWVEVLHQQPYSDHPNGPQPTEVITYHSVSPGGRLCHTRRRYRVDFLVKWRHVCGNTNVFRSLYLYSAEEEGTTLAGPLVIDIDSDSVLSSGGYFPNIDHSLQTARRILDDHLSRLPETDYRVFFTGHKGFSIEVRPGALGDIRSDPYSSAWRKYLSSLRVLQVGTAKVDVLHHELRLQNSINHWMDDRGRKMYRMKYEVSPSALRTHNADYFCSRGEELAVAKRR